MAKGIALTVTHHDPEGQLYAQSVRMLPLLCDLYCHLTMVVTPDTPAHALVPLEMAGVYVTDGRGAIPTGIDYLGQWRRFAVEVAMREAPQATHLHFCDFDRILHWAECYPHELQAVLARLPAYDLTVLGRTARAFASHPRAQRDTEALVNHVFSLASGLEWDVTAASRGLSRQAAELLVSHCHDSTVGTDCSWVLFLQQQRTLKLNYISTEGLEFETLDRYANTVTTPQSAAEWLARLDGDPHHWSRRLALAGVEVEAIIKYRG